MKKVIMLFVTFAKLLMAARRAKVIAKPMFNSRIMDSKERDILMKKTFAELDIQRTEYR